MSHVLDPPLLNSDCSNGMFPVIRSVYSSVVALESTQTEPENAVFQLEEKVIEKVLKEVTDEEKTVYDRFKG